MDILGNIAKWLFILCLPILLLTAGIGWSVNSLWLYKYGFEEYNVGQTTGLAEAELEKAAAELISYFNSDEEYISLTVLKDGKPFELFNEREVIHLKDVKGLFRLNYRLLLGTLFYGLIFAAGPVTGACLQTGPFWRKARRPLAKAVVIGSGITLGLLLVLGIGSLLNFDQLFLMFHLISFTNEFWMLDPARDYLIMLFPAGFWYDAALFIGGITVGLAAILGGVSGVWLKRTKRQND